MAIALFGPEYLQFSGGGPAAEIRVFIFLPDTKVKAVLYMDQAATQTASNPIWTDRRGELVFWAEEGEYDLFYEFPGETGTTVRIEVTTDGDPEPNLRALGYRHTQNTSVQQVSINHGLTFRPAGIICLDTSGNQVDQEKIAHPAPGITEVYFGPGFGFSGIIDLS